MKKIPKSITVTVRNGGNFRATRPGRTYPSGDMDMVRVRGSFPKTPNPPYKVTYTVNPRGVYTVIDDNPDMFPSLLKNGEEWAKGGDGTFVCFISGLGWHGLRVSRRVEKVKK
jgi:hypothetical protein